MGSLTPPHDPSSLFIASGMEKRKWGQVLQSYIGALGLLHAATRRRIVEAPKGYVGLLDLLSFMALSFGAARSERNRRLWYDSEP